MVSGQSIACSIREGHHFAVIRAIAMRARTEALIFYVVATIEASMERRYSQRFSSRAARRARSGTARDKNVRATGTRARSLEGLACASRSRSVTYAQWISGFRSV